MTKNKTKAYQHRFGSRRRLGTIYLLLTASTAAAAAAATTTSAATTLEGSSAISSTATRTTTSRRKRSYSDLLDRDYNKNHQNHNKKNNNDHQDHSYHFDHHQRSNRKKYGYDDRGQLQTDETKPIRDRVLNPRHKSGIYKFLDKNESLPYTTLGDVWLCLLFALGWTMWLLSSRHSQQPATSMFDTQDSRKVMGNVLQVSLGEDNLGTGIPVYHAVIDYVVEGDDVDVEPIQVRKVFCTKKLFEEGFANVQVLVLYDDPTTAMLMEDYVRLKKEEETQGPPSLPITVLTYSIAIILISASIFGAVLVILRLPTKQEVFGWISLVVGVALLYPTAQTLYTFVCYVYSLAGPLSDRPGVIINGKRLTCTNRCHANLDPREVFEMNTNNKDGVNLELSALQLPSTDDNSIDDRAIDPKKMSTPKRLLYPNAGCGFGEYRVHMPRMRSSCSGRPRASSSVSSLSASGHSNRDMGRTLNLPVLGKIVRWEADLETS